VENSDIPDILVVLIIGIGFVAALLIGIGLLVYATLTKGRWGINLRPISCPNCGQRVPRVRVPTSADEGLWGGVTCPNCGCKMDKWGRRIAA
jgi:DNA-directed RNA polymerase subunit RPC12/RpoP